MTKWTTQPKPGFGWQYDQQDLSYDALLDNLSGAIVYYDASGNRTVWTNEIKSITD